MSELFTGGSGKAGKYVVEHLVQRGHKVWNIDRTILVHDTVQK